MGKGEEPLELRVENLGCGYDARSRHSRAPQAEHGRNGVRIPVHSRLAVSGAKGGEQ